MYAHHIVPSRVSVSLATMRSPAASCTLMSRSSHFILTTASRLICIVCDTPFSTENCCVSEPTHQLANSEKHINVENIARNIVA